MLMPRTVVSALAGKVWGSANPTACYLATGISKLLLSIDGRHTTNKNDAESSLETDPHDTRQQLWAPISKHLGDLLASAKVTSRVNKYTMKTSGL